MAEGIPEVRHGSLGGVGYRQRSDAGGPQFALIFVLLGWWRWPPLWLAITVPAVMLVLALWRLVLIPRQVRAIGYAERDDDLLIRRGIFFQRTMVVPYGRMQYVDVAVGPVERSLGLCTLKLHTASAGTNAQLPAFPQQRGHACASSFQLAEKPGWPGCEPGEQRN